jgi:hypothetical protein
MYSKSRASIPLKRTPLRAVTQKVLLGLTLLEAMAAATQVRR